jgi:hypothetical protein
VLQRRLEVLSDPLLAAQVNDIFPSFSLVSHLVMVSFVFIDVKAKWLLGTV